MCVYDVVATKNNDSNSSISSKASSQHCVLDEMVHMNDELVSYLLKTGSIVALAQRLDQEDDSVWTVAEEDRTAIHA